MTPLLIETAILFILIVLNGLFSMSETAVVSSRKARLQQAADEGDRRAQAALALADAPSRFLATVQIGITLIGILTGVFGGATLTAELAAALADVPALAPYSQAIAGLVVVLLLTFFSLVLGELVPKRIALNSPERIASRIARPMTALSRLAAPLVSSLGASTEFVIRALGIKQSTEPVVTAEEIKVLMEQGTEVGVFEEAEQRLIERVLDLDDRRVDALMTPRSKIVALDLGDSLEQVRDKLAQSLHSRFPVIQGSFDNVLGVVRAKDILGQHLADRPLDLAGLLRPAVFLPEATSALEVLKLFKEKGTHVGLVLDEFGGIQGMVTHNDVLEAIVGYDPSDEGPSEPEIVQRADGSWLIDGMTAIDEVKEAIGLDELPDEDSRRYQTLGGFIMAEVRGVPKAGQQIDWRGFRFEVVDMDGRRVDKVWVVRAEAEEKS